MKNLILLVFLTALFSNCEINALVNEYEEINNKWEISLTEGLPQSIKSELKYFDLSLCKPKKRAMKSDSFGCLGSINDSSPFGLSLSYSIKSNQQLMINSILIRQDIAEGVFSQRKLTDLEIALTSELGGLWNYEISGDKMIWINDNKKKIEFNIKY